MTGLPDLNFPAFHAAAARLRELGHDAVNPAEVNPDPDMAWEICLKRDIPALLSCDGIVLLAGWQRSRGARLEMHIATELQLEILRLGDVEACR
jgi:hypothetical protein